MVMAKKTNSQKNTNKFLYVIIAILGVLCLSLTLYIFQLLNRPKQTNQILNTHSLSWKVFEDDNDFYTISYPADSQVGRTQLRTSEPVIFDMITFRSAPFTNPYTPSHWTLFISQIYPNPQNLSLIDWAKTQNGSTSGYHKTTIGGHEAITWTHSDDPGTNEQTQVYFVKQKNGIIYILLSYENQSAEKITQKMIASIKFTH